MSPNFLFRYTLLVVIIPFSCPAHKQAKFMTEKKKLRIPLSYLAHCHVLLAAEGALLEIHGSGIAGWVPSHT